MSNEWIKHDNHNYKINIDEVLVYVQVKWNKKQEDNINELYINKNKSINIFDSGDPFYNDVCFSYTIDNKTDIYLKDRRENYFIEDALCEKDCTQVGYEENTKRVICCLIKI